MLVTEIGTLQRSSNTSDGHQSYQRIGGPHRIYELHGKPNFYEKLDIKTWYD